MAVTLASIKAEQNRLAKLIAIFESQSTFDYRVPEAEIILQPGEHYAGLVLDEDGEPSHHLILLVGEAEKTTWSNAQTWAAEQGGELPTRREQALLYANLPSQFQRAWYWSAEQHKEDPSYAWGQLFGRGNQYGYDGTSAGLRARAVRRLVIE